MSLLQRSEDRPRNTQNAAITNLLLRYGEYFAGSPQKPPLSHKSPGFAKNPGAAAVNGLGCDLLRATSSGNLLISPYSMQTALAMTYAGAAGTTRYEMARVLYYGEDEEALHASLAGIQKDLAKIASDPARHVGAGDPFVLTVANRLFGQQGYDFRPAFLELAANTYGAPFQPADFTNNAAGETKTINAWVEQQTRQRIRNVVPEGALNRDTRLLLVNAIYLKASWQNAIDKYLTRPHAFHLENGEAAEVPTMTHQGPMGYAKEDGYTAVSLFYLGGDVQFLILLPDEGTRLDVTPEILARAAELPPREVTLLLPKFRMEPPPLQLSEQLKKLGMRTAFNEPKGSADFDRMAPRRPDDYLYISEVFHKTFFELDEKGTEAAAATAAASSMQVCLRVPVAEVRVDRPFVFAIQHRASGACLFLGSLQDPR